jgi:hypothetical protein
MRATPLIPWDPTVRNRVIADAVRICLSYPGLFNAYEWKFLLHLFHAPPDYCLSQRQGRFLTRLLKRTENAPMLPRFAFRGGW